MIDEDKLRGKLINYVRFNPSKITGQEIETIIQTVKECEDNG